MLRVCVVAVLLSLAAGRLRVPPVVSPPRSGSSPGDGSAPAVDLAGQIARKRVEVQTLEGLVRAASQEASTATISVPMAHPAEVAHRDASSGSRSPNREPATEEEKLNALQNGLSAMRSLRTIFDRARTGPTDGAQKFADGALSDELSRRDSPFWSSIDSMIDSTHNAMGLMRGKSGTDQKKLMTTLEGELDSKVKVMSGVNTKVNRKQQKLDDEYLLGLLLMHQKDWSMKQQLNATVTFMHASPLIAELYAHHDAGKPLAAQLATLMDAEPRTVAKALLQLAAQQFVHH